MESELFIDRYTPPSDPTASDTAPPQPQIAESELFVDRTVPPPEKQGVLAAFGSGLHGAAHDVASGAYRLDATILPFDEAYSDYRARVQNARADETGVAAAPYTLTRTVHGAARSLGLMGAGALGGTVGMFGVLGTTVANQSYMRYTAANADPDKLAQYVLTDTAFELMLMPIFGRIGKVMGFGGTVEEGFLHMARGSRTAGKQLIKNSVGRTVVETFEESATTLGQEANAAKLLQEKYRGKNWSDVAGDPQFQADTFAALKDTVLQTLLIGGVTGGADIATEPVRRHAYNKQISSMETAMRNAYNQPVTEGNVSSFALLGLPREGVTDDYIGNLSKLDPEAVTTASNGPSRGKVEKAIQTILQANDPIYKNTIGNEIWRRQVVRAAKNITEKGGLTPRQQEEVARVAQELADRTLADVASSENITTPPPVDKTAEDAADADADALASVLAGGDAVSENKAVDEEIAGKAGTPPQEQQAGQIVRGVDEAGRNTITMPDGTVMVEVPSATTPVAQQQAATPTPQSVAEPVVQQQTEPAAETGPPKTKMGIPIDPVWHTEVGGLTEASTHVVRQGTQGEIEDLVRHGMLIPAPDVIAAHDAAVVRGEKYKRKPGKQYEKKMGYAAEDQLGTNVARSLKRNDEFPTISVPLGSLPKRTDLPGTGKLAAITLETPGLKIITDNGNRIETPQEYVDRMAKVATPPVAKLSATSPAAPVPTDAATPTPPAEPVAKKRLGTKPATPVKAAKPATFDDMVGEALRWKAAALQSEPVNGTRQERVQHSRMTTKGDLDAYLMKKFGINEADARTVSNELTRKNLQSDAPVDMEAFKNEPWYRAKPAAEPEVKDVTQFSNARWTISEGKQIGTVENPKTAAHKKTPGDLQAATSAAAFYARRDKKPMMVVDGNSYGHFVWQIGDAKTDMLGKSPTGAPERSVVVVFPDGTVVQGKAKRATPVKAAKPTRKPGLNKADKPVKAKAIKLISAALEGIRRANFKGFPKEFAQNMSRLFAKHRGYPLGTGLREVQEKMSLHVGWHDETNSRSGELAKYAVESLNPDRTTGKPRSRLLWGIPVVVGKNDSGTMLLEHFQQVNPSLTMEDVFEGLTAEYDYYIARGETGVFVGLTPQSNSDATFDAAEKAAEEENAEHASTNNAEIALFVEEAQRIKNIPESERTGGQKRILARYELYDNETQETAPSEMPSEIAAIQAKIDAVQPITPQERTALELWKENNGITSFSITQDDLFYTPTESDTGTETSPTTPTNITAEGKVDKRFNPAKNRIVLPYPARSLTTDMLRMSESDFEDLRRVAWRANAQAYIDQGHPEMIPDSYWRLFEREPWARAILEEMAAGGNKKVLWSVTKPASTSEDQTPPSVFDQEYAKAVAIGDISSAQKMVDDAARNAGYTIGTVYHGTPFGNFAERAVTATKAREDLLLQKRKLEAEQQAMRDINWEILGTKGFYNPEAQLAREMLREIEAKIEEIDRSLPAKPVLGDVFSATQRQDRGYLGEGFYFTPSYEMARGYSSSAYRSRKAGDLSPYVYQVHLRIENPYKPGMKVVSPKTDASSEARLQYIRDPFARQMEESKIQRERLIESGYDGVIGNYGEGVEYVAFYPNQIKRSDAIIRDDAGHIIPLSLRFNMEQPDSRFSIIGKGGVFVPKTTPAQQAMAKGILSGKALTVAQVQATADTMLKGTVQVRVFQSLDELPPTLITPSNLRYAKAHKADGFLTTDIRTGDSVVVLVADNIHSTEQLAQTIMHEGLGHYGVQQLFGAEGAAELMASLHEIGVNIPEAALADIARSRGLDMVTDKATIIAEYIATRGGTWANRGLWRRFVDAIKQVAHKYLGINYEYADIDRILQRAYKLQFEAPPAKKKLGRAVVVPQQAPAFSTTESAPTTAVPTMVRTLNDANVLSGKTRLSESLREFKLTQQAQTPGTTVNSYSVGTVMDSGNKIVDEFAATIAHLPAMEQIAQLESVANSILDDPSFLTNNAVIKVFAVGRILRTMDSLVDLKTNAGVDNVTRLTQSLESKASFGGGYLRAFLILAKNCPKEQAAITIAQVEKVVSVTAIENLGGTLAVTDSREKMEETIATADKAAVVETKPVVNAVEQAVAVIERVMVEGVAEDTTDDIRGLKGVEVSGKAGREQRAKWEAEHPGETIGDINKLLALDPRVTQAEYDAAKRLLADSGVDITAQLAKLEALYKSPEAVLAAWQNDIAPKIAKAVARALAKKKLAKPQGIHEFFGALNNIFPAIKTALAGKTDPIARFQAILAEYAKNPAKYRDSVDKVLAELQSKYGADLEYGLVIAELQRSFTPYTERQARAALASARASFQISLNTWLIASPNERAAIKTNLIRMVLANGTEVDGEIHANLLAQIEAMFEKSRLLTLKRMVDRGSIFSPKAEKKIVNRFHDPQLKRFVELYQLGALTDAKFTEEISTFMGWPKLTDQFKADVLDIITRMMEVEVDPVTKSSFTHGTILQELNTRIAKETGLTYKQVLGFMWYGNLLLAVGPNMGNMIGNITTTGANMLVLAGRDPKHAPQILATWFAGAQRFIAQGGVGAIWHGDYRLTEATSIIVNPTSFESHRPNMKPLQKALTFPAKGIRLLAIVDSIFTAANIETKALFNQYQHARTEHPTFSQEETDQFVRKTMGFSAMGPIGTPDKVKLDVFRKKAQQLVKEKKALPSDVERIAHSMWRAEFPIDIYEDARMYAQSLRFTRRPDGVLGLVHDFIMQLRRAHPVSEVFTAFMTVGLNATNLMLSMSPWGLIRLYTWNPKNTIGKSAFEGSPEQQMEQYFQMRGLLLASAVVYTAVAAAAYMAKDDDEPWLELTGSGSSIPAGRRKNSELAGWEKYKFRVRIPGGKYLQFDYTLTPFALAFAQIGEMLDNEKWGDKDKSLPNNIVDSIWNSRMIVVDNWALAALTNLVAREGAGADTESTLKSMVFRPVVRTASGLVPFASLLREIETTVNPTKRRVNTFFEMLGSQLPIGRSIVGEEQYNMFGEPLGKPGLPPRIGTSQSLTKEKLLVADWNLRGHYVSFGTAKTVQLGNLSVPLTNYEESQIAERMGLAYDKKFKADYAQIKGLTDQEIPFYIKSLEHLRNGVRAQYAAYLWETKRSEMQTRLDRALGKKMKGF